MVTLDSRFTRRLLTALLLVLFCLKLAHADGQGGEAPDVTLLFVDDADILYRSGTERRLHQPERYVGNPVITGPNIHNQLAYSSVYRDPVSGKYQAWYQLTGAGQVVCYAESEDGLTWTKPNLGLYDFKGVADPNIVFTSVGHFGASVWVDPPGGDPSRRYKMVYWSLPPVEGEPPTPKDNRGPDGGMYVAFSPDGIHWTPHPGPVLRGSYGRSQQPPTPDEGYPWGIPASVSDVLDVGYDPLNEKYVVYAKGWIDGPDGKLFWKRSVYRTESTDFVHWSKPELVMAPDEFDGEVPIKINGTRTGVQLHGAPVFYQDSVYFALIQKSYFEGDGQQPIELAISRDGLKWQRPFREVDFIPMGEEGTFDAGRIFSNATPVVLDDEIRFYYGAYEHPWKFGKGEYPWGGEHPRPKTGLGLAVLPRDRFAGIIPLNKIGQVTLQPRSLEGVSELTVNVDASKGMAWVELLDADGYRVPGFTKDDAVPLTGNSLRQPVAWKVRSLSDLPPGEYSIRIHLKDAEVFALSLE